MGWGLLKPGEKPELSPPSEDPRGPVSFQEEHFLCVDEFRYLQPLSTRDRSGKWVQGTEAEPQQEG